MNELTAQDIDRLAREMVERIHGVSGTSEDLMGAEIGRIMAEYPPAVGWCYVMLTLSDLLQGRPNVRVLRGRRR